MKFENYDFHPLLKKSIELAGYKRPTDIQFKAIPHILKGEDLLAIAQTGTGKTAAFAIPLIQKIDSHNRKTRFKHLSCVVMVPTRELAIQIHDVFQQFSKKMKVQSLAIFGGVDQNPQIARLVKGVDIVVATPGRLFDLSSQGYLDLRHIRYLVLDEADHMLDLGFIQDIRQLTRFLPKKRQTLFISATINEKIKKIAYELVRKPVRIQISPKDPVSKTIDHFLIKVEMDNKRFYLERMVRENPDSKILVFVRTKVRAERLQKAMARVGIDTNVLHGGVDQRDRLSRLHAFGQSKFKVLIATDVGARGIDIDDVKIVVNYDLPEKAENYVHRVGRTGRAKNKGLAFSFCSAGEEKRLKEVQAYLDKEIKELVIPLEDQREILDISDEKNITMTDIEKMIERQEKSVKQKKKN